MILYFIVVVSSLLFALMAGWILPFLFSAKSDEAVMIGIGTLMFTPIVFFYLYRTAERIFKKGDKNEKNNHDDHC